MQIMIVGPFSGQATEAAKIAMERGAHICHVDNTDMAMHQLRTAGSVDALLVDLTLDITRFIDILASERFHIPIIACGIDADPKQAEKAIQAGAKDYMPFPPDPEMIAAILAAISQENHTLIFRDDVMAKWVKMAERIAPTEANILLTGESGTGKEVMARFIHQHSHRRHKNFVSVNCAAIPENLLESELFGHEKGAFTGAVARRIGKFEEAHNGTLLLDEISEMHPRLQAKLLRAIQERVIDRVGGTKPVPVNIRIIATSNRDLLQACQDGDFREDLYYRLNVVNLHLPPLHERPLDIIALAQHFAAHYTALNRIPAKTFSDAATILLQQYTWPGNVRELENTIHRAILLATKDEIEAEDLYLNSREQLDATTALDKQINIGRSIASVEKEHILSTLDHCAGNRTHAANILGISIRTLRNKLKAYALEEAPSSAPSHAHY